MNGDNESDEEGGNYTELMRKDENEKSLCNLLKVIHSLSLL